MASTQGDVRRFYQGRAAKEDRRNRRNQRVHILESHCTKRLLEPYITPDARVVEFGCATGYYAEHWHETCASYLGVDIVPENVDFFNAKALTNAHAQLGDATNCPELADESFDVVLCLGPMYHLPEEERALVMAEMARICRPGGVLAFAFINKMGLVYHAMDNGWGNKYLSFWQRRRRNYYPNRPGNDAIFAGVNDIDGPFFFTMPEELEALATQCGLRNIRSAGVEFGYNGKQINAMDDAQFALFLEIAEAAMHYPSCAGMSNHALMLCEK